MATFFALLLCFFVHIFQSAEGKVHMLDMSRPLNNDTLYPPLGPAAHFEHEITVIRRNSYVEWFQSGTFAAREHGGTHMDAPIHHVKGAWAVDEIPPERLVGLPVVVLNVKANVEQNNDYLITKDDALSWETEYGRIPDGSVILICTGWESRYPNLTLVWGNDQGDRNNLHWPGLSGELSEWLVSDREVFGVGTDGPSTDGAANIINGVSHVILARNNIWGLEQLLGTCSLPAQGARLTTLPMKIEGGSGGPVRVVATWGEGEERIIVRNGCRSEGQTAKTIIVIIAFVAVIANPLTYT